MKNFFKHLIGFLFIYTPIRAIIEVTTGGNLTDFLTVQQLLTTLLTSAFMAATIPYLVKKD